MYLSRKHSYMTYFHYENKIRLKYYIFNINVIPSYCHSTMSS